MKINGWIFLVLGWGFVLTLAIYCYTKLLSNKHR
jgi:glycerol uptake facilitator-like aquaporin